MLFRSKWDVRIKFFNSEGTHKFSLEQDGNWLHGIHQGEFSTREIMGTIEGNEVKLQSMEHPTGDHVPFLFAGKLESGKISGVIHMGEYRTATFTASRYNYKTKRSRITVPGGPPLAT